MLIANGKRCHDFGLPTPTIAPTNPALSFNTVQAAEVGAEMEISINGKQKKAFEEVMSAAYSNYNSIKCFFLDEPGGSGKTYLYKTLLSSIRGKGDVALPVASTGLAANLLDGGRTYHSQFKLPIPILETLVSSMRLTSEEANFTRRSKAIIWDEATMAPADALRCTDKLLQDIMKNDLPFGGKTIFLGGDFRQTLLVLPHGNRAAIVEKTLKFHPLWSKFHILQLDNNVPATDPNFSSWLIKLGDGSLTNEYSLHDDIFQIPNEMVCTGSLVEQIFGHSLQASNVHQFANKAILCPKNIHVDEINQQVLDLLDGETVTYFSTDVIDDATPEDANNYPVEFLSALSPSGMPLHTLNIKVGAIIMLLRNLNTKRGLCNGTRLLVQSLKKHIIIAKILTGLAAGTTIFIPRIDLAPANTDLPFVLRRRQFPIKLAFAMTINKS